MPDRVDRRLAAVFAGDIAGYSRLMGADEEGTLRRLKACRRQLVDPKISEHRGRIVKTTGDGMLVEFGSAVDAARCAVEIQRGMAGPMSASRKAAASNSGSASTSATSSSMRTTSLATASISRPVWKESRSQVAFASPMIPTGKSAARSTMNSTTWAPQTLKNIAEPMRAWRVLLGATLLQLQSPTFASIRPVLALPDKPSIAVLPFQNMSGDPEQEYFADGMVEDIITALSRIPWLFVIARNSSFTYKGRAVDVKQVGRELGVRYVLEGSVRKAAGRVRITGQLIDAATGAHLWADRFDGAAR